MSLLRGYHNRVVDITYCMGKSKTGVVSRIESERGTLIVRALDGREYRVAPLWPEESVGHSPLVGAAIDDGSEFQGDLAEVSTLAEAVQAIDIALLELDEEGELAELAGRFSDLAEDLRDDDITPDDAADALERLITADEFPESFEAYAVALVDRLRRA